MSQNMKKTLLTFFLLFAPLASHAACSSPTGNEAEIIYNADYNVMQFCNGTNWISMSSTVVDSGVPSGAVMSFNLASCPTGWSEYTLARGRFIRGIDSTGTNDPDGVRALGSTQDDELAAHSHTVGSNIASTAGSNRITTWGNTSNGTVNTTSTGGDETRPKNVALLFCEKD
jgi:hypothetical protein